MAEPKLLDDFNRALDRLTHVQQGWKNWLASHDLSLFEQYVKMGRHFALDFKLLNRRQEVPVCGRVWAIHQSDGAAIITNQVFHPDEGRCHGGDKHVVLIDLIELVECPEEIVPLLKWPDPIGDEITDPWQGSLYRSFSSSVYKILPSFIEGKVDMSSRLAVIPDDLGGDIIKSSPQIVYRITHTQKEIGRRLDGDVDTNAVKARIVIGLIGDTVEIRLQVADGYVLELSDVAFGPVDL